MQKGVLIIGLGLTLLASGCTTTFKQAPVNSSELCEVCWEPKGCYLLTANEHARRITSLPIPNHCTLLALLRKPAIDRPVSLSNLPPVWFGTSGSQLRMEAQLKFALGYPD